LFWLGARTKFLSGANSTRWPGQVASAENVDVQVRHGFAAVRAVVDDEPVAAFFQAHLVRDFGGLEQNVSEQWLVGGRCFGDARNKFLRKNQNVRRRLRIDVAEGE